MPYLEDGRPVDIVLNPLGVPSRMNVGQILETHLGWAARKARPAASTRCSRRSSGPTCCASSSRRSSRATGAPTSASCSSSTRSPTRRCPKLAPEARAAASHVATPGVRRRPARRRSARCSRTGRPPRQSILFDGRTGEPFDQDVTVGVMYMLKLHHLVDDKIHARSIGPYSLVTQQPLGGKAQFGGQRLGEMEVWAMEAYGAAYALQEFLTVKSDDVVGPHPDVRGHRQGREHARVGPARVVQRAHQGAAEPGLDVELIENRAEAVKAPRERGRHRRRGATVARAWPRPRRPPRRAMTRNAECRDRGTRP